MQSNRKLALLTPLQSINIWSAPEIHRTKNWRVPTLCSVQFAIFGKTNSVYSAHCPCGSHYNMQSNAKEVSAAYSSSKRQFFTWLVAGSKKVTTFTLGFTLIAVISIMQFKKTLRSSTRFFGLHKITVISNWEFHPKTKTCCV